MSKIGQHPTPSAPILKQQPVQTSRTAVKQVSAQQLSAMFDTLAAAAPRASTAAKGTHFATVAPAMASLTASTPATMEVLPHLLGPLRDEKMNECIDQAFHRFFEGKRPPTPQERTDFMAFAKKSREENPKMSAERLTSAIIDELRKKQSGLDTITSEGIDRFIKDAVKWVSQVYQGQAREASPAEFDEWRAFAQKTLAEAKAKATGSPEMTAEQLRHAITDAVRAKATGLTAGQDGKPDIDGFIKDAVKWVSQVYQGQAREASPAELDEWRAFAQKTLAEAKAKGQELTPEQLKYAIKDAVRANATGLTAGPGAKPDIDGFIKDAVKWVSQVYQGQAREASPAELDEWRAFAQKALAEAKAKGQELTPEQLKYAIKDAVRAKATGVAAGPGAKPDVDGFIKDAVKWVSQVYDGKTREASPEELTRWRQFAETKLSEAKAKGQELTPEQLKYVLRDAIRDDMRGVGGPAGAPNLEQFVKDAYQWVFELYRNQSPTQPRRPTDRELREWTAYARNELAKNPKLTHQELKFLIQDGLRTALGNS